MRKHCAVGSLILCCMLCLLAAFEARGAESEKIGVYYEESFGFEASGNYEASLNSVLKVLRIDRKNYLANLRAGWLNYLRGDLAASEKHYRKTIDLAPGAVEPRLGLLLPLIAAKKWSDAESVARKVLEIDGQNYTASSKLAYALFQQGKYADARGMYQKVLDAYPSDVEMKLGLAWSYQHLGKREEARRLFQEVLEIYRTNPSALLGMESLQKGM